MEARSHASPMDFEYSDRAPGREGRSGFATVTGASGQQQTENMAKKRNYSAFNSPQKPLGFYSLPSPATSLFHPSTPAQPSLPLKNPAFTTLQLHDPQSSDAESSPEPNNNTDGEATPTSVDMGFRSGLSKTTSAMKHFVASGVGPDSPLTNKHTSPKKSQLAIMRVDKRQNRRLAKVGSERRLFRRNGSSDSDRDEGDGPGHDRSQQAQGMLASFFGFIETHPNLPHLLSYYAQLLLNVFLVMCVIYAVYSFWSTIRSDVDQKAEEAVADILAEMAVCAKDYRENNCDSERRAPALETVCNNWERCMKRDPKAVGRARVSAHTFAEIFNSFIEPISIKAMAFTFLLAVSCFAVSNMAFGLFRNKTHPHPIYPPTTPQPYPMSARQDRDYYWTPSQTRSALPQREPAPSVRGIEPRTPNRQLTYQ